METEKISVLLNNLYQKTLEKKIDWKVINPQAVRWTRMVKDKPIVVTLQLQSLPIQALNRKGQYSINIQSPPEVVFAMNTLNDPQYINELERLFNVASNFAKDSSAGIIDDLLGSLE